MANGYGKRARYLGLAVAGAAVLVVVWIALATSTRSPVEEPQPTQSPLTDEQSLEARVHEVVEVELRGPVQTPRDTPARDLRVTGVFRHDSGQEREIEGFWDGDGSGGTTGDVFVLRFTPTLPGRWVLATVRSDEPSLDAARQGLVVEVAGSQANPGFWEPDDSSPGRRWYRRSDGSHPYIFGNTHYTFLSEMAGEEPGGNDVATDVEANAEYFSKLRFSASNAWNSDPELASFFDDEGRPTNDGEYSHRPNPVWFRERLDRAVATAYDRDLIADLILVPPTDPAARAVLKGGDAGAYLRYIAARYGSFPNVWITLGNEITREFDNGAPSYTLDEVIEAGQTLQEWLPYPTPVSKHDPGRWQEELVTDPLWYDHVSTFRKRTDLSDAADWIERNRGTAGNVPVVNDEQSYEGAGDGHSTLDTVEAHLGAFVGGGYATTGYKQQWRESQYFWGGFDPEEHRAAEHLRWLRDRIDGAIPFWTMEPIDVDERVSGGAGGWRMLAGPGQLALGTDNAREGVVVDLGEGAWTVTRHDVVAMDSTTIARDVSGEFRFDTTSSRAVLYHFAEA